MAARQIKVIGWHLQGVGEKGRRQKAGHPEIQGERLSVRTFFEVARVYI